MPRVATTSRKPARASTSRSTSRPRRNAFAQVRAAADPVTAYAKAVKRGAIVAGPHVRAACDRHLRDLVHGAQRGLRWDIASVQRVVGYFRDVLRLNGGQWEGLPYELLGWQLFVVGSLYGWKREDGYRRFTTAFVETGKGSGKSPLAAGIGLYGLTADGESRAEIYAAATKKDQAMVLFRDAVTMVDLSPDLTHVIAKSGVGENTWNLAYRKTGSWFRPISSDDGQSGPRPHVSLLDEIHEHRTGLMVEMMKAGQKGKRQPLMLMITNSGFDKQSVCWEYHAHGAKVASGAVEDDAFFAFICALDDGEDPFKDEASWAKVNPSLQESDLPGMKYLREQVASARGIPSKESTVRRLNFCQWVDADNPAIPRHLWEACADAGFDAEQLRGRRCWGGLDLSSTTDLTAFALLFEPVDGDPVWRLVVRFWIPGDELAEKGDRDRVPYLAWRDRGYIAALPGRAIDKLAVARQCAEDCAAFDLQELAYDRWRIEDFRRLCNDEGLELPLVEFGQGFKDMSPAIDHFETLLANRELRHDANPVMTWCAANTVHESDAAGNRKVSKKRATGRVDGMVAAVMAAGRASLGHETTSSYPEVFTV